MPTDTRDPTDRLPTTGPERAPYEQYRFTTTADGRGLVYHVDRAEWWIEAESTLALAAWR